MKNINKFSIFHIVIIIILLITNYLSYFEHQQFKMFVKANITNMKEIIDIVLVNLQRFFYWIGSQNYDFSLNNRELAFVIIFTAVSIWIIYDKKPRKSFMDLIKSLLNKNFNRVYIEVLLYTIIICMILYKLNYWEFEFTKDTMIWIVFSSIYLCFKVADSKGNKIVFKEILRGTFSLLLVMESILNIYTFGLIAEIISIL